MRTGVSSKKRLTQRYEMPFGATVTEEGNVHFQLWAPEAKKVELCLVEKNDRGRILEMDVDEQGWYRLITDQAGPGTLYQYRVDEDLMVPDPASRYQPQDIQGPSQVVDPSTFQWTDQTWTGRPWEEVVLYELHVGTFTPEGTYTGVKNKLDYLKEIGVTAIELMPIADFPGERNWGYDGVLPFAPDHTYGTPDELKDLIQTAHEKGIMVFLDVVYNHFGPEGNYLYVYARNAFFNDSHHTPWGAAINYDGPKSRTVRDFFIHNALYWLEEFHFDGLRLDAVHAIRDTSTPDILEELAERVRKGPGASRYIHLVLENDNNQTRYLGTPSGESVSEQPALYNAQWNDDIHHALHILLTQEIDGYYADYTEESSFSSPIQHLGRCLAEGFAYQGEPSAYRGVDSRGESSVHLPATAFVSFIQNHDQIGNRAFGERLSSISEPDNLKIAVSILLLSPTIPLMFMGEEWRARQPFLFFCNFEGDLGPLITEGRRREFALFNEFSDPDKREQIPDPESEGTFLKSILNWDDLDQPWHGDWLSLHKTLLEIRRRELIPRLKEMSGGQNTYQILGNQSLKVSWTLGDGSRLGVLCNFGPEDCAISQAVVPAGEVLYESIVDAAGQVNHGRIPAHSAVWYLMRKS